MNGHDDLRVQVDDFVNTQKSVDAFPLIWNLDHRSGEQIIAVPLRLDGENVGRLELNSYPREPQPAFRILLIWQVCVCRLDCRALEGPHYNDADRPEGLGYGPIFDHHFHSWQDNRRFARYNSLPLRLRNARELPRPLTVFDAALRWFCNECNIDISGLELPSPPPRDQLL